MDVLKINDDDDDDDYVFRSMPHETKGSYHRVGWNEMKWNDLGEKLA